MRDNNDPIIIFSHAPVCYFQLNFVSPASLQIRWCARIMFVEIVSISIYRGYTCNTSTCSVQPLLTACCRDNVHGSEHMDHGAPSIAAGEHLK